MNIPLGVYTVTTGQEGNEPISEDIDVKALLTVSTDLSKEFAEQASRYAWIAMIAAKTDAIYTDARRELAVAEAHANIEVRRSLTRDEEKITEKRVDAEVLMTKMYIEASEYELACREQFLIMKALCTALEQRAQMLSQLGAHMRAESDMTGMLIRDTKYKLRTLRAIHDNVPVASKMDPEDIPF